MFVHMLVLMPGLMTARSAALAETPARTATKPIKMVVLGDSLSAGLASPAAAAFPERLQKALKAKGIAVDIDQCRGVRRHQLRAVATGSTGQCPREPQAVIVELGANDALARHRPRGYARGACPTF